MAPIYRQNFTISDVHLDCFGRAKPSALLLFAQEVASHHCTQLAVDQTYLSARHLFWAVSRHKVQITRLPTYGETITVETWPMPTTRVAYPRSVVAYDQKGNELFRSISLWVLMDIRTRAMVLPGKSQVLVEGTCRGNELDVPRSIVPAPLSQHCRRAVVYSELDRNGHMNNTRYLDWVDDLLSIDFHRQRPVRAFTVCYLSEAKLGDEVALSWELSEDFSFRVDGHRDTPEGDRIFSVIAEF